MEQMQWLTKKIVFSSSHIALGVKFVNFPFSFSWKEQVMELSHCVTLHCCLCTSICVVIDSHSIIYESQSPMNRSGSTAQPLFIPFNLLVWLSIAVFLQVGVALELITMSPWLPILLLMFPRRRLQWYFEDTCPAVLWLRVWVEVVVPFIFSCNVSDAIKFFWFLSGWQGEFHCIEFIFLLAIARIGFDSN